MAELGSSNGFGKRKRGLSLSDRIGRTAPGRSESAFVLHRTQHTAGPLSTNDIPRHDRTGEEELLQQCNVAVTRSRTPVTDETPAVVDEHNRTDVLEPRVHCTLHHASRDRSTGTSGHWFLPNVVDAAVAGLPTGVKQEPSRSPLQGNSKTHKLRCPSSKCSEAHERLQQIRSCLEQITKLRKEKEAGQAVCARLVQRRKQRELTYADMLRKRRDLNIGIERVLQSMEEDDVRQCHVEQAVRENEKAVELVMIEIQALSGHT